MNRNIFMGSFNCNENYNDDDVKLTLQDWKPEHNSLMLAKKL